MEVGELAKTVQAGEKLLQSSRVGMAGGGLAILRRSEEDQSQHEKTTDTSAGVAPWKPQG